MLVECPACEAQVDGKVLASHKNPVTEEEPFQTKVSLLGCPICGNAVLACQTFIETSLKEYEWSSTTRVWPSPDPHVSWVLPGLVRSSLQAANKCFKAGVYDACAVMCGRTLEAICHHYKLEGKSLAEGLKKLLEDGVIDRRLFSWAEELRKSRNLGAHVTGETISKDDARDLLNFVNAICEYIFVLEAQFKQYMSRRSKSLTKKP